MTSRCSPPAPDRSGTAPLRGSQPPCPCLVMTEREEEDAAWAAAALQGSWQGPEAKGKDVAGKRMHKVKALPRDRDGAVLFGDSFTHQRTSQDSTLKLQLCTTALKMTQVRQSKGLRLKPHLPGVGNWAWSAASPLGAGATAQQRDTATTRCSWHYIALPKDHSEQSMVGHQGRAFVASGGVTA